MTIQHAYLSEDILGIYLKELFPNTEIIHDQPVPLSNIRNRPDYRIESLKLIVEFDGNFHYTSPTAIINDSKKDQVYLAMGYTIIRVPYYVQMTHNVQHFLFGKACSINGTFPHGFISSKLVLPADFCEMGINKFKLDLVRFSFIEQEIITSLWHRPELLKHELLVFPPSLLTQMNDKMLEYVGE